MPPKSHSEISGKTKDLSKCQHSSLLFVILLCLFFYTDLCIYERVCMKHEFFQIEHWAKMPLCWLLHASLLQRSYFLPLFCLCMSYLNVYPHVFLQLSLSPHLSPFHLCPELTQWSWWLISMATGWCSKQAKVSLPSWMFRGSPSDLTTTSSACLADKQNLK